MVKISINAKLAVLGFLLVFIPCLVIGLVGYSAAKTAVYHGTEDRMQVNAKIWKIVLASYDKEIKKQEDTANQMAKDIVTAQAKSTYQFVAHEVEEYGSNISTKELDEVFSRLNAQTVGKTGYIWILDYKGNYVLSKGRQRDGENIWNAKDTNGVYFVQELVKIGQSLKGDEIGYLTYPWQNKGETTPRNKIAALVHIPEKGWVIGASTYYDDLVDVSYREKTLDELKNLISKQVIGKSGYIWIVNSTGHYIVSKNRLRDGENIFNSKDSNGVYFIQEMIKRAKAADAGTSFTKVEGTDLYAYPWQNIGETTPRMKVAGLAYYAPFDWTIGVSAYYDDFDGEDSLGLVRRNLITVIVIGVILGTLVALFVALRISKPIKSLTKTANEISDGNFDAKVEVMSNDEVGELAASMETLVSGFKAMKGTSSKEDKPKDKKK